MQKKQRMDKWILLLLCASMLAGMLWVGFNYHPNYKGKSATDVELVDEDSLIQRTLPKVEVALQNGDFDLAVAVLNELDGMVEKRNADLAYELGIATSFDEIEMAIDYFEEAQMLDAENYELSGLIEKLTRMKSEEDESYQAILLGQTLGSINEWLWAKYAFEMATEASPDYAEGWAFLGKAEELIGADGEDALVKGYHLNPESISALVFLADYYVTHEEVMQGVSLYRKAIELNETNDVLYVSLANGYVRAGDLQSAIEAFEEGLVAVPYSKDLRHAYLDFLLFYEIYLEEKALPIVEELNELADYGMTINLYSGRIELALGDFENAKVYLESVVDYEPDNLTAQYYLGICLVQLNDREGAILALENALELDEQKIYTDQITPILEAIK